MNTPHFGRFTAARYGYDKWPWRAKGTGVSLDRVLEAAREVWPDAYMEGSAGLGRMILIPAKPHDTRNFVAYAWSSGRRYTDEGDFAWSYIVFDELHVW